MKLTEPEREAIERALDALVVAPYEPRTFRLYERAISIVRERAPGVRRIRSDAGIPRRGHLDILQDSP